MNDRPGCPPSILMLSLHGYVAAEPELGRPDTGGQVVFVLELAKRLRDLGCTVDIVTRRFESQPAFDEMGSGLRVWRVPFAGEEFVRKEDMHDHLRGFVSVFMAAIAGTERRYDVISSHYWDAGWAGRALARELGIAHVHTPHSLGWWKREEMQGGDPDIETSYRFSERIEKEAAIYRDCDLLIATSYEQLHQLRDHYGVPDARMVMIPPGIDEARFSPVGEDERARLRRRLRFKKRDVYTVGRAAANKGYDLLIRCLPALRELVGDARLQLAAGAGSARDRRQVRTWKQIAAGLGVEEHVKWLGYVEDDQMVDHYRAAPVFALPSRYEPFGMTAVEAMACGTPTVVTVHGGLSEMFEFGCEALFADPKRSREFAAMLSMPIRYPRLWRRLSAEGARLAHRRFGWGRIAERTFEILDEARSRHGSVPEAAVATGQPRSSGVDPPAEN